jgi:hypothetical protein
MYSPHPTHKQYNKNRKSQMVTFSINTLHLPTVSNYYYNPTHAKDLKRISAKQDSNQERATKLKPKRAVMAPLTCEL